MINKKIYIIGIGFIILFFPVKAYGYIDPGSFTMLLQVIFATIGGIVFTFRNAISILIKKVFSIFKKSDK